ncbi:HAMP domain-containing sensor histidine kinase [Viridibacterium curvum]|uniref:histidine kinase n=1 Tax=Viridibacterium curvum TaxID=1101404 RepID=A0ABP9QRG6_9RHOO
MQSLSRALAWLASIRLRFFFRVVFLLLACAIVALAVFVLREEKQQGFDAYREGFAKTADQIAARLRHPTGQLALLNPEAGGQHLTPLRPLLLPYAALDFDDPGKVRVAVETSGCLVQYPDDAAMCVAVGSRQWAGAFVYVAGRVNVDTLVSHRQGQRDLSLAHRMRVQLALRGVQYNWLAVFEGETPPEARAQRGRLTGFVERADGDYSRMRPQRDFRGWLWQSPECARPQEVPQGAADCAREVFYSLRLPVALLAEEFDTRRNTVWPPPDLADMRVSLALHAPGNATPLFDSNHDEARMVFQLDDLRSLLLPGESLMIRKVGSSKPGAELLRMVGTDDSEDPVSPLINALIRRLPVDAGTLKLDAQEFISTPGGRYELLLAGDVRNANRILARTATRMSWIVGALLLAIGIAWFLIELGIIRRIAILTRRTRAARQLATAAERLEQFDVADLRGGDELGILATNLHELQGRVREDMAREKIRAAQEKDMWHAVGHEIMSPLQSLLALHGSDEDASRRYLLRMQQAIRVLYGHASPSEAFETTQLQLQALDVDAFLQAIAQNAPAAGIADVRYTPAGAPVLARADEFPLEDVVTHVLSNAARFRLPDTPISIELARDAERVHIRIHNAGPQIAPDMLDKIFEYGVSDQPDSAAQGNRGQGLFVARTYMAKMGGTIAARNEEDGVSFTLSLMPAKDSA